jgi:hypothetical protein
MSKPKLAFLTSCTATKAIHWSTTFLEYDRYFGQPEEFMDLVNVNREGGKKVVRAGDLYQGPNADNARELKILLEQKYDVTHYIFSAAFGIVHEDTMLPGYSCTFSGASEFDRIYLEEFKEWVKITNQDELPKGSLICLPNSYMKALKHVIDPTEHYIIPVDNRARQTLACPSIHACVLWDIFVAEEGMALNWSIDQWPILSEVLMDEGMEELEKGKDADGTEI